MSLADTNVLVRASLAHAPDHDRARTALFALAAEETMSVSRQIMREYVAVLTRPQVWGAPVTVVEAMRRVESATTGFTVLDGVPEVWARLRQLSDRAVFGGKQVHDANIVATMLVYGQRRLLTFNAKDFRRFEPLIEIITP